MNKQSESRKQARSFGRVFAVVFLCVALWPLIIGGAIRWGWLGLSITVALVAQFVPMWLVFPARWWLALGLLLHRLTNPVILGLLYFALFTPLGLLMRGMRRKFRGDSGQTSYWVDRKPPGPTPESMRKQF